MARVAVTKVTVEYVTEGKRLIAELDPNEVASIVFSLDDLQRAQKEQFEATGEMPDQLFFDFRDPFSGPGVKVSLAGSANGDEKGPPLWWHTNGCSWIHDDEFSVERVADEAGVSA
ncbi:MAG: hypothetical protein ACREMQ_04545 [Longimicrobiales bacterium]